MAYYALIMSSHEQEHFKLAFEQDKASISAQVDSGLKVLVNFKPLSQIPV